jgi:hypothetical protein
MGRGSAAELIRYALKHGRTTPLAWKQPRINHRASGVQAQAPPMSSPQDSALEKLVRI